MIIDPAAECERFLVPGEKLLWSGTPGRIFRLRPVDLLLVPFSLFWAGFVVFWEASVVSKGGPPFMQLWGIPFVLMGAYFVFGRFLLDARARRRTAYAVTSERVLVVGGLWRQSVHAYYVQHLHAAQFEEHGDGTATITLLPGMIPSVWQGRAAGWGVWHGWSPYRFERLRDGKQVYDLIMSAAGATRT